IIDEYDCYFLCSQADKNKFEFKNYIEKYKEIILT
ncbi:glycosyl transferase, partial [Escherichia coli]|nr:glycosyl transferase [Escherichia coli]